MRAELRLQRAAMWLAAAFRVHDDANLERADLEMREAAIAFDRTLSDKARARLRRA